MNTAYTNEYRLYRQRFEYLFCDEYKGSVSEKVLSDGVRRLQTTQYEHIFDKQGKPSCYEHAIRTHLFDAGNKIMAEIKNIYGIPFFSEIRHRDGHHYLLFSIDLYGYSIMDLADYSMHHFVPEESIFHQEETFIWTDAMYCPQNNFLAVDGCYWACPYGVEFFDLSDPLCLPYKRILSTYELYKGMEANHGIEPVKWNDNGTFVLSFYTDKNGMEKIERTIDVLSYKK